MPLLVGNSVRPPTKIRRMKPTDSAPELQAKALAGRLLSLGASRASAGLDQFSSWLLSGFGAAFALLLANIDPVSKHLSVSALRCALLMFLAVLVLGVLSRLLAVVVCAGAGVAAEAESIGRGLADSEIEVNFKRVFREAERVVYWPVRLVVSSSFKQVEQGDFAATGRLHAKLAQAQGALVFVQVVIATIAALVLACGLTIEPIVRATGP